MTCTGAILIGGKSSRIGSPKHELVLPDGRTMFEHVSAALGRVCSSVVVVGGVDAAGELRVWREFPIRMIADCRPHAGPLGAIEALLASGIDSQYLICPCDVPLVTKELLELLTNATDSLASVFQIEGRDEIEPLPAMIRAEVLPAVRRLLNAQQRSVWRLMKEVRPHIIAITKYQAGLLHNVNTPEDYEIAARIMAQEPRVSTRG